jgi:hypothetical protein
MPLVMRTLHNGPQHGEIRHDDSPQSAKVEAKRVYIKKKSLPQSSERASLLRFMRPTE